MHLGVRLPALLGVLAGLLLAAGRDLAGQGLTTTGVRGTVEIEGGADADGARVSIRNASTGFVIETTVRHGRFLIEGLEIGGPYSLSVRSIGAYPWRRDSILLSLGELLRLRVMLLPAPVQLDSIVATAQRTSTSRRDGGTGTTLSDSLIHRLPSLNRDVYDFLRLVPQLSTRIGLPAGGISAGGVGFRFNQFLTNGVPERSLAGGQPPEFAGGKSLPFEAVREYQVVLAPFDVRYGDFAGAMINTVTRSGSNTLSGSLFGMHRSEALGPGGALAPTPYQRHQFGAALSGPLVRDRLHFLAAFEHQDLTAPMRGPYFGQPANAITPLPISEDQVEQLAVLLRGYSLEPGGGGSLVNENRLGNLFVRLDAALTAAGTRAVLWFNGADVHDLSFSRESSSETFALSSHAAANAFQTRTLAFQVFTALRRPGGGANAFSISHRAIDFGAAPTVREPIVRVQAPALSGGVVTVITGTPPQAHAPPTQSWSVNLRDELSLPIGASHLLTLGVESEWFNLRPGGVANSLGTWSFQSLDSLEAGVVDRYDRAINFGNATVPISGAQVGAFLGDHWQVGDRLSVTLGVRGDFLAVVQRPPHNALVDSLWGERTDTRFGRRVHFSPRLGFSWSLTALDRDRVRGGVGVFTGRPPLAWLHVPIQNHGDGIGTLRCGSEPGDLGAAPPFHPDPANPPVACAGGEGLDIPPRGDVELIANNLRMAQTLRAVLAYERRLPGGFVMTAEALLTHGLNDFAFRNLNLAGPVTTDPRGRVIYGSIDTLGRGRPTRVSNELPSVMQLRNVSGNHAVTLSLGLERRFAAGTSLRAAYASTRARDVQTPLRVNNRGLVNWGATATSGRHDEDRIGISLNDVPHRVVLAATWRAPWSRWVTEISLLYVGESGSPFTYRAGGAGGRGDLNADGALNDPVYIPLSALDPDEIQFTGVSSLPGADNSPPAREIRIMNQRNEFENFIASTPCLRQQRGTILTRNSCREPWSHTTVASLRQALPVGRGSLELQVDAYNILNMINSAWGHRRVVGDVALLEHVQQVVGSGGTSAPVFRFAPASAGMASVPSESVFQLQLGARYRF